MRRAIFLATVLFTLALAASASAKGVLSATVCGKSECREVDQRTVGPYLANGWGYVEPPSSGAPFYRVTVVVGDELATKPEQRVQDRFTITVVPDRRLARGEQGDWMRMTAEDVAAYRKVLEGIEPFPASELRGVPEPDAAESGATGGSDGGPPAWPFVIVAALSLIALSGLFVRRRVAARGA